MYAYMGYPWTVVVSKKKYYMNWVTSDKHITASHSHVLANPPGTRVANTIMKAAIINGKE